MSVNSMYHHPSLEHISGQFLFSIADWHDYARYVTVSPLQTAVAVPACFNPMPFPEPRRYIAGGRLIDASIIVCGGVTAEYEYTTRIGYTYGALH